MTNNTFKKEIWVSGYVHSCGGAGPELAHQIDLWLAHGVEVHLCVFGEHDEVLHPDNPRRQWCEERGVHTHLYEPGIFEGKVLVSFCQNDFMDHLPEICATGRPRLVVWFNCMTWNHGKEPEYLREDYIDVWGFQSQYQRGVLLPALQAVGKPIRELDGYLAYYSLRDDNIHAPTFRLRDDGDEFVIGRLSRDDPNKWPANWWEMCFRVSTPRAKRIFAVGYGENAREKCGDPQTQDFAARLNRQWWGYCSNSEQLMGEFWPRIDVLLHKWDSFKENYPRALLEAMAAGVPIVCDRAGGNPEIVIDGETGFLVDSVDEAVYRTSQLAWNQELRHRIACNARAWLAQTVSSEDLCWQPWQRLFDSL